MAGNKKYKNEDIEDGKPIKLPYGLGNVTVYFYNEKPDTQLFPGLDDLRSRGLVVMSRNAEENSPKEIADDIAIANMEPYTNYALLIECNNKEKEKDILTAIRDRLIKDREVMKFRKNLAVVFYPNGQQEPSFKEFVESGELKDWYVLGMPTKVLSMSTENSSPKKIAEEITRTSNESSDVPFVPVHVFATISYRNKKEKEDIINLIKKELEKEVFKGLSRGFKTEDPGDEIGPWRGFETEWVDSGKRTGTVRKE